MTRPLVIVTSGAYIPQELSAEFGPLPPSFLPVGMRRLYELQVELLRELDPVLFLTLPESLTPPAWDAERLAAAGVELLPSPDGLSLGAALLHALAKIGFDERPVRILHGDTLVEGLDLQAQDAVSVAGGGDGYRWATVHVTGGTVDRVLPPDLMGAAPEEVLLSGYFSFASVPELARARALAQGDFIERLNLYGQARPLRALRGDRWLDFGHVQTFFRSRRVVSTARSFNQLEISETTVRKSSHHSDKLRAEAEWLKGAPPEIRTFCARVIDDGVDEAGHYYKTDYEYLPTLAELYVFGRLNRASWMRILGSCASFVDAAAGEPAPEEAASALRRLAVDKTQARLEEFARASGYDLDAPNRLNGRPAPSLRQCSEQLASLITPEPPRPALMHGDFCFPNILYDFRRSRIRLIDPRGFIEEGSPSLYGDLRYDVAKLAHSVVGRYDMIIAGCYTAAGTAGDLHLSFPDDPEKAWLERVAEELSFGGVRLGAPVVQAVTATLFLSMLPLHADRPDRQTAFIANALRLFEALERGAGA